MLPKMNIYQISLTVLSIFIFSSCDKSDELDVSSANFTVSSKTVYLNEVCNFEAIDALGGSNYQWNFGDGILLKDGYKVTHQYNESGNYNANLKIKGLQNSKTIRVLPGRMSYQIANTSKHYQDLLLYIDNYEFGCTKRIFLVQESLSDTIYATSSLYANNSSLTHSHIFGISIFVENSEYTFPDLVWIKDFQHHIITIADTTRLIPRSSHGNEPVVLLKDLYPPK